VRDAIDLHSHWIAGIDDGVRTIVDARALLEGLRAVGFAQVIATPHMRPGMFDNDAAALRAAFDATCRSIDADPNVRSSSLPSLGLGCEHFLDDVVFERLRSGQAIPYPGGHAALVELPPRGFPKRIDAVLRELRRANIRPVLAHPERYEPVWRDVEVLEPLVDAGALLQLDVAALVGKYGRSPQRAAERLVEDGWYTAASSDAHKPSDVDDVARGIARLEELAGREEADFLLRDGPSAILAGRTDELGA
jgi:protein-tyrosine phosphatase